MCIKINWSIKSRDIGLVWEFLAQGYGFLAILIHWLVIYPVRLCPAFKQLGSGKLDNTGPGFLIV